MCALFLLSLGACQQIDKLTQFDVPYTTSFTVPATTVTNLGLPIDLTTPKVQNDNQQTFQLNNTAEDKIEEVYLKELELVITNPSGEDFSFLEEAEIFIKADGLPEVSIASKKPVPATTGNSLTFDTSGEDLTAYIKAEEFTLRVRTVLDEAISVDHEIEVRTVFRVDAKVLGV